MRGPIGRPTVSRRAKIAIGAVVVILVLLLITPRVVGIITDWLWYSDLGYSNVMSTMFVTRLVVFLVTTIAVAAVIFGAVYAAYRVRPEFLPVSAPGDPLERYRQSVGKHPRWASITPAVVIGLVSGLVAQTSWDTVQLFIHGESFGVRDAQFNLDISFYAFELPFLRMILNYLFVAVVVGFVLNLVTHYVFGGIRVGGGGRQGAISRPARIQLVVLAGIFMLLKAVGYWFDRYDLLSSERRGDIFTGATYTDTNTVLPAKLILMSIAILCAVAFFSAIVLRDLRIPAVSAVLMLLSALVIGVIWPAGVEQFSVKPSAATREADYIKRNINATLEAYQIRPGKDVQYEDNWTSQAADPQKVNADSATLSNIRILDPNVVAPAFTQRQALKNIYGFPSALSVDRYKVDGQQRDFIVAARELDPQRYGDNQANWINKHTVYTHGDGFIAAQANKVDAATGNNASDSERGGLPVFEVSDLGTINTDDYKKNSPIKVKQPRIYFGELIAKVDPDYAIVGSDGEAKEFDGDNRKYYAYTGDSGVKLSNFMVRSLYAIKYGERNFLLSDAINDNSRILYNRDPRDRVKKAAPWLTVDSKIYPAVMDDGSIKWIVDGYTTLEKYPYAQRMALQDVTTDAQQEVNRGQSGRTQDAANVSYVRNSVKATVDAYTGKVDLYQFDDQDPVLKTWMKVFPGTVHSRAELDKKKDLLAHVRYPEDLFKLQRQLLTQYHVTDPSVFFQNSNRWSVPSDPTTDDTGNQPPYYFTATKQDGTGSEFQLTAVTNVMNRQNLASFISASADPDDYGKITVKVLPTGKQTVGPGQASENMLRYGKVTQELKLVENTKITYGNLLALPVGQNGLLYVQPVYTQAQSGSSAVPKLYRVLTYYNAATSVDDVKIGFAPTVKRALEQVGIDPGSATAPQEESDQGESSDDTKPNQTTPSTVPSTGNTNDEKRRQAAQNLKSALAELQQAQSSGDSARWGQAIKKVQEATDAYLTLDGG